MSKIISKDALSIYVSDMARYALTVIRARSLPEVDDGLKPSQRRDIWAMIDGQNITDSEATKQKCAAVVGRVIERYHMHGDSSAYETLVPLANWYQTKEPLLSPYGNFGSFLGDGAAAMRYTGIYFSKFGYEVMIKPLKETEQIVDWSIAANESYKEPDTLPCLLPLLLINGTFGIAVGIQTEIPSHNLVEVIDETLKLLDDPNHEVVLVPDHCLPCEIINTDWKSICNKGEGNYKVRAKIEIGQWEYQGKMYVALFILSVPARVNYDTIKNTINTMVGKGKLPQLYKMISYSNDHEMREIILLKNGADPNFVKEMLYKYTALQSSYRVNFEVIRGIEPLRMSYTSYLQYFIEHAKTLKFRLHCNKMRIINTRYNQIDAYVKILESGKIDEVIKRIRHAKSTDIDELIAWLIDKIKLNPIQARYIIDLKLPRLAIGYLDQYRAEAEMLKNKSIELEKYLMDDGDKLLAEEVRQDLLYFRNTYGKPRTCTIIDAAEADMIPRGRFKLVITENGFLRKLSLTDPVNPIKGDSPRFVIEIENTSSLLLFDNKGKVFKLLIHKVPVCDKKYGGIDARQILKGLTANIINIIDESSLKQITDIQTKHYIIVLTEGNCIKKLDIKDFFSIAPSGIIYTKLNKDDFVKNVILCPAPLDVVVYNYHKALRMSCNDIPLYQRSALGANAMDTAEPITGISILYPDTTHIIAITRSGKCNMIDISALQRSKRYKSGSAVIKLKNDQLVGVEAVNANYFVRAITMDGFIDIDPLTLQVTSSISGGIKLPIKSDIIKTELYRKH